MRVQAKNNPWELNMSKYFPCTSQLASASDSLRLLGSRRPVNVPVSFVRNFFQVRVGIHGKRMHCQLKHGCIMNGIAEAYVYLLLDYFSDGLSLAGPAGHADEPISDLSIFNMDAGGQHTTPRDAKTLYAFAHHPVIGGRDGPNLASNGFQFAREPQHLRENAFFHNA